ncbi:MAG TPA: TonB-dependent receptor, partial [Pedomonas sp.]|uniref:TonB-dependent receptor domain-containing protein n=1 Tax=Pedomonas sp. TaxID=2976421 RepID=UPI002F429F32
DTLVYLSLARGYKGGGVNPPRVDFNTDVVQYQYLPQTFKPEFVNSIEIGTKNSFNGGRLTLNANAFLYDYKDYQVSQIVDRISYNENFDAINWGLELEAAWRPTRAFRLDGNLGYLKTRLKKGSKSIDVMNRTQGDDDWMVVRPWLQVPSNCIAPRAFVEKVLNGIPIADLGVRALSGLCPGADRVGSYDPEKTAGIPLHLLYGFTYDPFADYNPDTVGLDIANGGSGAPNGGRGFYADLNGNELPNAPRWTVNVGAQYTFYSESDDWELTFRADYYWQAKSYARIYNTAFDRLKAWDNVNLSATYMHSPWGLSVQAYVKNVFNNAPITDTFVNSDDTGLTTNVFTLDPRIFGFSIAKKF